MLTVKRLLRKIIDKVFFGDRRINYRVALFEEFKRYNGGKNFTGEIVLEIGSRDGQDTERLLALNPQELQLVDLPGGNQDQQEWYKAISSDPRVKSVLGNFAYDLLFENNTFSVIWCSGVLYHNTEQLRFLRLLYDALKPNGILVLESATTKTRKLKNLKVVEILYPPSEKTKKNYHISSNVTHLPSKSAVRAWLEMVGFGEIFESKCHDAQSFFLGDHRAAFICRKSTNGITPSSPVEKQSAYLYGRSR